MSVFPTQDLYSRKICESYQDLLQIYRGNLVLNGSGSQLQYLNVTASYALNCCPNSSSTSLFTGSTYPITSSWSINSTYSQTASYAYNYGNSITQSFTTSSTWVFNHNLNSKYSIIQAYDNSNNQIIPEIINLFDDNTAILVFSTQTSGTALATRGGIRVFSSSYGYYNLNTGSTYPITSSNSLNSTNSLTSSYVKVKNVNFPIKTITSGYNITLSDYTVLCNAISGSFNVKLPVPSSHTQIFNIKKIDNSTSSIHIITQNSSYIDFQITQSILQRGTSLSIQSDGTQYWLI